MCGKHLRHLVSGQRDGNQWLCRLSVFCIRMFRFGMRRFVLRWESLRGESLYWRRLHLFQLRLEFVHVSTCTSSYCGSSGCTTSGCGGSSCVQSTCGCPLAELAGNGYPGGGDQDQASLFSQDVAAPIVSLGPAADGRLACSSNASGLHLVVYRDQGRIGQRQCRPQGRIVAELELPDRAEVG